MGTGARVAGRGLREVRSGTALLLVAGLATASCAGGADEESSVSASSPAGADGQRDGEVLVTETDYALTLPEGDLPPGQTAFVVDNVGSSPHDLAISGPGLEMEVSDTVRPGETTQLSVELEPGTYTLWCTVGNHRALGMEAELVVAG
jgi:plastocyanin